jgi:hypothetical protein
MFSKIPQNVKNLFSTNQGYSRFTNESIEMQDLSNNFYEETPNDNSETIPIEDPNTEFTDNPIYEQPQARFAPAAGAAAGGSSSSAAAASSQNSAASNAATGKAIKSGADIFSATNALLNNRMNLSSKSEMQNKYFQEAQGSEGTHMHTGLHADMNFAARNQTLAEQKNVQTLGSAFGGPIGGLIGHFISKNHISDMEKNLNLNTVMGTLGEMVNPATALTDAFNDRYELSSTFSDDSISSRYSSSTDMTNYTNEVEQYARDFDSPQSMDLLYPSNSNSNHDQIFSPDQPILTNYSSSDYI